MSSEKAFGVIGLVAASLALLLVNRDSVRHSLGRVEGQSAGFPETVAGLPGREPMRAVPTVILRQLSLRKKL
jgi:hypothetical protein